MDTLKKFMIVLNNADKYPTEHELAEAALVARDKLNRLVEQRDAALKLADEILMHRVSPLLRDSEWVMGRMDGKRDVANKIRAIFEPKE